MGFMTTDALYRPLALFWILHWDGWSLRRSGLGGKSGDQRARERSSFV